MFGFGKSNKKSLLKGLFGKYSPAGFSGKNVGSTDDVKEIPIDFIMVYISDDQHDMYNDALGAIIDISHENKGTVMDVIGSLVFIAFNLPGLEQDNPEQLRQSTVDALIRELNESIRILHGRVNTHTGTFGNKQRASYTAFFPDFDKYLMKLVSLNNGEQLHTHS